MPGSFYILVWKCDNPNQEFDWKLESYPVEIDKFEFLSTKKESVGQTREHTNFQCCKDTCSHNVIKLDEIKKEKSNSAKKGENLI